MFQSKLGRALIGVVFPSVLVAALIAGCNGGTGGDNPTGTAFNSDGGAGSTLSIRFSGPLSVGGTTSFFVTAVDPNGDPLAFIRIFCESESGIAILEPSSGGVAFESTGAAGVMSGVIGGLTPGSYLMECRGPQGFNLLARKSILITGDVPPDFIGFPGAAGGNLGGGLIVDVEGDGEDFTLTQVRFTGVTGDVERNGAIDINFNPDCNNDGLFDDPEDYGFDDWVIQYNNGRADRIFVETVTYSVNIAGSIATSTVQLGGLIIEPGTKGEFDGSFTEFPLGSNTKIFAGVTPTRAVPTGTYNVTFTITGTTGSGDAFTVTQTASVTFGAVNNC